MGSQRVGHDWVTNACGAHKDEIYILYIHIKLYTPTYVYNYAYVILYIIHISICLYFLVCLFVGKETTYMFVCMYIYTCTLKNICI